MTRGPICKHEHIHMHKQTNDYSNKSEMNQ